MIKLTIELFYMKTLLISVVFAAYPHNS